MNARGLELATNVLVVLIVSIVTLGLAGGITWKIFCSSSDRIDQLDAQAEKYIEQRLTSGAAVQVPDAAKSAKAPASFCGARAPAYAEFGLGVRNDANVPATFSITCTYDGVEQGTSFTPTVGTEDCTSGRWATQFKGTLELGGRERDTVLMIFNVPSGVSAGRHVFTVRVHDQADPAVLYGAAKIYLSVE
jgi:hypothetical protein